MAPSVSLLTGFDHIIVYNHIILLFLQDHKAVKVTYYAEICS